MSTTTVSLPSQTVSEVAASVAVPVVPLEITMLDADAV
jgi:hypothetical protein